jgi:hypothetical protein
MATHIRSIGDYVKVHGLEIDLGQAYEFAGAFMEEFDDDELIAHIPQGVLREIRDVMVGAYPLIDRMTWDDMRVTKLVVHADVARVEASEAQKAAAISSIMEDVADAVADAVWEHCNRQPLSEIFPDNDFSPPHAEHGEDQVRIDDELRRLRTKVKSELGVIG